jgi:[acyl-carrier-protein] S-malonyltransferase
MNGTKVIMFPGLGATYPRMVEKFLLAHPQDAALLASWAQAVGVPLGGDIPADRREAERQNQMEIHALNLLWWRHSELEARDAAVCGHSLGYYAALVAAGVIDEASSFRLIDAVFTAAWRAFAGRDETIFVVTAKKDYDFASLLHELGVEVLSENNAMQRVLYGTREQHAQVRERMNGQLLTSGEIGTTVPFHARCMRELCGELAQVIAALGIVAGPIKAPLWSHITARPIPTGEQALALVLDQLHRPVRWHQLVEALIQAGRYEFSEVGPNRVLSQCVRWISSRLDVRFVDHLRRQGAAA